MDLADGRVGAKGDRAAMAASGREAVFPRDGINPGFSRAALTAGALAALDTDGLWISPEPLLTAKGVAFAESELLSMMNR